MDYGKRDLSCGWEKILQRNLRWRRKRQAEGFCLQCLKHPPRPGYVTCEICAEYLSRKRKELAAKRREAGLCQKCGKIPSNGFALCLGCRIKQSERDAVVKLTTEEKQ